MTPNKDTKLYFSISSNPGNFGATIYNAIFEYFNMNAIYLPLKLDEKASFDSFLKICSAMDIQGISVSMPFKKYLYKNCVFGDDFLASIGNGNTIVMKHGVPFAYNTDVVGFERSCEDLLKNSKTAIIVGSGAVSDTICFVLKKYKIDFQKVKREDRYPLSHYEADFLINATPIGMNERYPNNLFTKEVVKNYKYIFDVVVNNNTDLLNLSRALKKEYISGISMVYYGLMRQIELYVQQYRFLPDGFLLKKIKDMGLTYERLQ
jgi:shikimate 5-dehydrogenase